MSYRPPNWNNPHSHELKDYQDGERIIVANPLHYEFEAGADAILEAQLPLLKQVYAQLCGVRLKQGKTDYYSALDESIDKLKPMVMEET